MSKLIFPLLKNIKNFMLVIYIKLKKKVQRLFGHTLSVNFFNHKKYLGKRYLELLK